MTKQKETEQQDGQRPIREDLIRVVLDGARTAMDEDSINAAATLLLEIETNKVLIHHLQTGQLSGRVDNDGQVTLRILAGCDGQTKVGAA